MQTRALRRTASLGSVQRDTIEVGDQLANALDGAVRRAVGDGGDGGEGGGGKGFEQRGVALHEPLALVPLGRAHPAAEVLDQRLQEVGAGVFFDNDGHEAAQARQRQRHEARARGVAGGGRRQVKHGLRARVDELVQLRVQQLRLDSQQRRALVRRQGVRPAMGVPVRVLNKQRKKKERDEKKGRGGAAPPA